MATSRSCPNVVEPGLHEAQARAILLQTLGFTDEQIPVAVARTPSDPAQDGKVIRQDPAAEKAVDPT